MNPFYIKFQILPGKLAAILAAISFGILALLPFKAAAEMVCHPGFHTPTTTLTCTQRARTINNPPGLAFFAKDQASLVKVMRGNGLQRKDFDQHPLHHKPRKFIKPEPHLVRHDHPARCTLSSTGIVVCFGAFPVRTTRFFERDGRLENRDRFTKDRRFLETTRRDYRRGINRRRFTRDGFTIEEVPAPLFRLERFFPSPKFQQTFPALPRHSLRHKDFGHNEFRRKNFPLLPQRHQNLHRGQGNYLSPPFSRFDP